MSMQPPEYVAVAGATGVKSDAPGAFSGPPRLDASTVVL
jgi:hypothetical protein